MTAKLDGHHGDENDGILSENTRMQTNLLVVSLDLPRFASSFKICFLVPHQAARIAASQGFPGKVYSTHNPTPLTSLNLIPWILCQGEETMTDGSHKH